MSDEAAWTRREFLASGAAGAAGAALFGSCSRSMTEQPARKPKLVFRILGRTGLRLPVVSVGSTHDGSLVHAALEAGMVYLQSAGSYAEGNHERLLGRVLQGRPRESFVVASCADLPYQYDRAQDRSLDLQKGANPSLIADSMHVSLKRLGLDYMNIFYLGSVGTREVTLHEPYMKAFEKLKRDGKTRFVGVTTHRNEPEVIRAVAESGFWDVVLTACNFRQSYREEIRAAIGEAARAGIGVVAMKTQAGVYWSGSRQRINMKAALKWVLQDENVHTSIPAFSNYDEMWEDLSVMEDLTLTREERQDLRLGEALGLSGYYCQQCGQCLPQCRSGMDVPTFMRSAMYAFGYRQPGKARHALGCLGTADIACRDCTRCTVHCPLGHDVRSRTLDLAGLLEGRLTDASPAS